MQNNDFYDSLLNRKFERKICVECAMPQENTNINICPQCGNNYKGKNLSILDCLVINELRNIKWKEFKFNSEYAFDLLKYLNKKIEHNKLELFEYIKLKIEDKIHDKDYIKKLNERLSN